MKYTYGISDKVIAYLTLISGLIISAVAVWYSVAGLVSILSAAATSIIIMGVALEASKLVATVWLKWNWKRAPRLIKIYLISAIAILMLITSMGIFGFLSKAHLDQNLVSGDVVDKVALIDEKIKTQKDNIEAARKALRQMDEAVDQTMSRSTSEQGADKAANLRRAQQRERTNLQNDIAKAQSEIAKLNEQRAPIAKELRAVEAEVGPIKYIAKLIYGDNPDANILEKAVTWVIIIIVLVFDPLAVVLLLASQYSFQWFRQEKDTTEGDSPTSQESVDSPTVTDNDTVDNNQFQEPNENHKVSLWPFPSHIGQKEQDIPVLENEEMWSQRSIDEANSKIAELDKEVDVESALASIEDLEKENEKNALDEWNKMIEEAERAVEQEKELEDHEIIENAHDTEKEAMRRWKEENPDSSLKQQRKLFDKGVIKKLPWEDYLKAQADFDDDDAEAEAVKWALEQKEKRDAIKAQLTSEEPLESEEDKKKDNNLDGNSQGSTNQTESNRLTGYVQNAEQNESTIWQRVQKSKEQ